MVAVLPFRNLSRDTAQQYFSAGMTEEIATELSRVAALRVLSRAATAQYDTAGDRLKRMSRELGVGSVVDGSVRLAGDRVRIAVELTNVRTGQSLWSEQYDRQLSDLFAVQDDVAHKVTAALQARLTPAEAKRVAHAPTSNMAAYQLYLRALDLNPTLRTENLSGGELLGQAIRLDSGFAAAYAQLARNQMFRSVAGERAYTDSAFIAARKAIALDPELADGWFALADLESVVLKLSDARRSYLKALELNPSHGGAMADLANVYVALGRFDEALDWSLRNQQLNPNQTHAPYHVALGLMPLDDDSATERFLLAAERQFPTELRIQGLLAWLDLRRGSNRAALERARRMVRNAPDDTEGPPILAELAVVVGDTGAERLIEPLARQDPEAAGQMFPESLRSLYALTLQRQGDTRRAAELWRASAAAAHRQPRCRRGELHGPDGAGRDQRHRGPHRCGARVARARLPGRMEGRPVPESRPLLRIGAAGAALPGAGHRHDAGRGGDAEARGRRASLAVQPGVTGRALIRHSGAAPAKLGPPLDQIAVPRPSVDQVGVALTALDAARRGLHLSRAGHRLTTTTIGDRP